MCNPNHCAWDKNACFSSVHVTACHVRVISASTGNLQFLKAVSFPTSLSRKGLSFPDFWFLMLLLQDGISDVCCSVIGFTEGGSH